MKFTAIFGIAALAVLGFADSAGAATAGVYSGHFPLTVSKSQHSNGKLCLILTDDGSAGFPHTAAGRRWPARKSASSRSLAAPCW